MNVKTLIAKLSAMPDNAEVYIGTTSDLCGSVELNIDPMGAYAVIRNKKDTESAKNNRPQTAETMFGSLFNLEKV